MTRAERAGRRRSTSRRCGSRAAAPRSSGSSSSGSRRGSSNSSRAAASEPRRGRPWPPGRPFPRIRWRMECCFLLARLAAEPAAAAAGGGSSSASVALGRAAGPTVPTVSERGKRWRRRCWGLCACFCFRWVVACCVSCFLVSRQRCRRQRRWPATLLALLASMYTPPLAPYACTFRNHSIEKVTSSLPPCAYLVCTCDTSILRGIGAFPTASPWRSSVASPRPSPSGAPPRPLSARRMTLERKLSREEVTPRDIGSLLGVSVAAQPPGGGGSEDAAGVAVSEDQVN